MKTYVTVHAVARHKDKYLVLQRAEHRSSPGTWNCITGYLQDRESAEDAALRELKEETNLEGKILKTSSPFWLDDNENQMRWVVISSLIEVDRIEDLKIDEEESQDHKWIDTKDELISGSSGLRDSLANLGLLK